MRRFLYFLPGVPGANPALLADRGLLSRFRKFGGPLIEHGISECLHGPAGGGCIVAAGAAGAAYLPASQRWLEGERLWVGIEDANFPPRACDLQRECGIDGYQAALGNMEAWCVPLLRKWDPEKLAHVPNLPQSLAPATKDGRRIMVAKVVPEFAAADELAQRIFASFSESAVAPMEEVFADAVDVLGVNYRIGLEEAGLLGLLDAESAMQVLKLSIDVPKIERQAQELSGAGLTFPEPQIEKE